MEDDLNFLGKWKTNTTGLATGRRPQILKQMEDSINFLVNGRHLKYLLATIWPELGTAQPHLVSFYTDMIYSLDRENMGADLGLAQFNKCKSSSKY